jgi:hypothetical protein
MNYGYGAMRWRGRTVGAHRVAYELTHGPIPTGAVIRHSCDVTNCCNPAHLLTGTLADNMRDAADRQRMPLDTRHHASHDLEFRGETHSLAGWSRLLGLSIHALQHRILRGWSVERILTMPVRPIHRKP